MNHFNEGNKFYNTQDYRRAIECYQKAANESLNEACSYYNIGVCFIKLKEFNKAIVVLNRAISIHPESKYIFNLGYCYAMKEITSKALYLFNLAWSLDPGDKECEKAVNLLLSKLF